MPANSYPLPYTFAWQHKVLLEVTTQNTVILWCSQAPNKGLWSEILRLSLPLIIPKIRFQSQDKLLELIQDAYLQNQSKAASIVTEVEQQADLVKLLEDIPAVEDLLDSIDDAPIIRLLNALLSQATSENASDIHIEPYERYSAVRFRIDGVLRLVLSPHRGLHNALISRIKIMANIDIAEKRLPQDGRFSLRIGNMSIDIRVSTLPNAYGERAVLRLLNKDGQRLQLQSLGLSAEIYHQFSRMLNMAHGLILVTGPTGSGKTTTLYAAIQQLNYKQYNILTVEDPIEYELPGIGQTQINNRISLDFPKALRAILRQDPDIIMIGEIRDRETAQTAIQAALTGHLVLATLHTNDATSAVNRLIDMSVEPFLLSSALLGVLAQRLVRCFCVYCHGTGCQHCHQTGYNHRIGIFELFEVDTKARELIHNNAAVAELLENAQKHGMHLMYEN
ncbi:MAG: ATPase, T2SS/T4P/T4SS family, partial [Gammaproteobacteria bacterium]|nr:ATPase, T2SS/T4P/T4SS family [Gammaproteobacteria bacterium]